MRLILLDDFLVLYNCLLICQYRLLIRENAFLVCYYFVLSHVWMLSEQPRPFRNNPAPGAGLVTPSSGLLEELLYPLRSDQRPL